MFGSQTFTMGFGSTQTSSPERPKARTEEKMLCLPVTVRLLELTHEAAKSTGGELRFHGSDTEPNMMLLVAAVEAVQGRSDTMLEFTVNDATGRLKARHFLSDPAQAEMLSKIVEGTYVSLYGNFRTAPMPHFVALGVRPVRSADEVSYHMIEVAHAALKSQCRDGTTISTTIPTEPATPAPRVQRQSEEVTAKELVTPPKMQALNEAPMPKLPEPEPQPALEGAMLRDAVLKVVQKEGGDTGFTAAKALEQLRTNGMEVKGAESAVLVALQALVDDGDVFNTIDDDHFGAV